MHLIPDKSLSLTKSHPILVESKLPIGHTLVNVVFTSSFLFSHGMGHVSGVNVITFNIIKSAFT